MKSMKLVLISSLLLVGSQAWAANMAALQYDVGNGVDPLVKDDVQSAMNDAVSASKWTLIDVGTARGKMNPIVRDCFTSDCLSKAGQQLNADAGVRLRFSGEAQIYDWTIEVYDLRNGALLQSEKGACELCGRSEVVRTFKASASSVVAATKLGAAPKKENKPVVETKPVDKPVDTVRPTNTGDVQLVRLMISVEPPDAKITFRDAEIGRGRTEVEVGPGNHEFSFEADGYRIVKELVVVEGDTPSSMSLRIHLPKKDAAPQAVEVSSRGPLDKLGSDRELYGWIGVGTGSLLLLTSAYMSAIDGDPTCDGPAADCPDVWDTDGVSYVTTAVGATVVTAGVVLLVWEALAGSDDPKAVKVAPTVSGDGAGVGIFGRF